MQYGFHRVSHRHPGTGRRVLSWPTWCFWGPLADVMAKRRRKEGRKKEEIKQDKEFLCCPIWEGSRRGLSAMTLLWLPNPDRTWSTWRTQPGSRQDRRMRGHFQTPAGNKRTNTFFWNYETNCKMLAMGLDLCPFPFMAHFEIFSMELRAQIWAETAGPSSKTHCKLTLS